MKIINDVEVLTTIHELVEPSRTAVLVIDMQNSGLKSLAYEEPGFERGGPDISYMVPTCIVTGTTRSQIMLLKAAMRRRLLKN